MDCDMTDLVGAEMTPRQGNDFQALIQKAASSEYPETQFQAAVTIRKLVSNEPNPALQPAATALINGGVLPILVNCLTNNSNPALQSEAAWTITNIASGPPETCHPVVEAGAVPILISLLSSPHEDLLTNTLCALANIAGDGPGPRAYVISMGITQLLLTLLNTVQTISVLRQITQVIKNLCINAQHSALLLPNTLLLVILPAISNLLNLTDIKVLENTLLAFGKIANAKNEQIQMVIETGCLPKFVAFLSHTNITVRTAALRTIGNIVVGTDEQTQAVLNCGALQYFRNLLITQQSPMIHSDIAWILSNIAAGNQTQIQEVIDSQLVPLVINKLDENERLCEQFGWIVSNITQGGNAAQVSYLIRSRVLPPLCKLLSSESLAIYRVAFDAVQNLLPKIRAEEIEEVRAQIAESFGPDQVDRFLGSMHDESLHLHQMPRPRQSKKEVGAGDFDDVLQNFKQMKLDF